MAKIAISPGVDPGLKCRASSEQGMTLFELLITLTIYATIASFVGVALSSSVSQRAFNHSIEQLEDDLKRAQLWSRAADETTIIDLTATGYRIDALTTERDWPGGVDVVWRVRTDNSWQVTDRVEMSPNRLSMLQLDIEIVRGDDIRHVFLDPVSGRIHAD